MALRLGLGLLPVLRDDDDDSLALRSIQVLCWLDVKSKRGRQTDRLTSQTDNERKTDVKTDR